MENTKYIYAISGKGERVQVPLKNHKKRNKKTWMKKYGEGGKCVGTFADPEDVWNKLEAADAKNKGKEIPKATQAGDK